MIRLPAAIRCCIAAVLLPILVGPPSSASPEEDLLRGLWEADHAVAQGIVRFRVTPPGGYGTEKPQPPGATSRPEVRVFPSAVEALIYDGPDRFRSTTTLPEADVPAFPVVGSDGITAFSASSTSSRTTILLKEHTAADGMKDFAPYAKLTPGPCFPMGRGLSTLRDLKASRLGKLWRVSGTGRDGSQVSAVIDPEHGYIARSIERSLSGRFLFRCQWAFGPPRRTSDGVWLPSSARTWVVLPKGDPFPATYELLDATFTRPESQSLAIDLSGKQVIDHRGGMAIGYDRLPPGVRTPEQLWPYTEQQVRRLARMDAALARRHRNERLLRWGIGALLALSAAFGGRMLLRARREARA